MNKLLEESYVAQLGSRALAKLNRDLGHGIAGKKSKFNAPENYEPGGTDDLVQGFNRGSMMINEEDEIFICIDGSASEARWIKLEGSVTKTSYDPNQEESEDVAAPEGKIEPDLEDVGEVTKDHVEELKKDASDKFQPKATAESKEKDVKERKTFSIESPPPAPGKSKTGIPENMPWATYLKKAGYESVEQLELLSEKEIADIPYMNKSRAQDLVKALASPEG